jgi:L-amino acid N-acyltransferase YncA
VDPAWRRRGIGRLLYTAFCERAAARGCRRVRALAAPTNARSLRFHESLGFVGRFSSQHVGPGQDRVVFERTLTPAP